MRSLGKGAWYAKSPSQGQRGAPNNARPSSMSSQAVYLGCKRGCFRGFSGLGGGSSSERAARGAPRPTQHAPIPEMGVRGCLYGLQSRPVWQAEPCGSGAVRSRMIWSHHCRAVCRSDFPCKLYGFRPPRPLSISSYVQRATMVTLHAPGGHRRNNFG